MYDIRKYLATITAMIYNGLGYVSLLAFCCI